ncbi:hypothetical protein [Microbacterium gorillae]|uniref:hypothetical protein n=1 Tax=Microbacterium gorillae TaxID=1231063 RepID=UPI0011448197|nr:hypothetical protein [Microbacterium gorillae]
MRPYNEADWAPPGFLRGYTFTLDTGRDDYVIEATLTVPAFAGDFSALLVRRVGGPVEADHEYRRNLYAAIGEVAVVAAQVETLLKRLIMLMADAPSGYLADAEGMFGKLEDTALRSAKRVVKAGSRDPESQGRAVGIIEAVEWAKRDKLGERRNDIVHGVWWDYAGVGVVYARFKLNGESDLRYGTTLDHITDVAAGMREYATRLEALVGTRWLTAYLPRGGPQEPSPFARAKLAARAVGASGAESAISESATAGPSG